MQNRIRALAVTGLVPGRALPGHSSPKRSGSRQPSGLPSVK